MSTELKSSNIEEGISLTRFWGGNQRGVMVTVNMPRDKEIVGEVSFSDSLFQSIQLTQEQALKLAKDLKRFATKGE
jgi:hypothetical protein